MSGDSWVPDDDLDAETRAALAAFTTLRRGMDGRWYWPVDEAIGERRPEPFPPTGETEIARREALERDEDGGA
jgi:hypothetical protein